MHPELFELKALVAGRLDAHRRREIDDHLGSCAECSRHYVALMLGSSSPKTAEMEARQGFAAAGTVLTLTGGSSGSTVEMFGIDAPLSPSVPKPPVRTGPTTLETEFPAASSRTQVPVSASLVDAIAKLRAESEAQKSAPAAEAARAVPAAHSREFVAPPVPTAHSREFVAPPAPARNSLEFAAPPVPESSLIEPSIFLPTPADGVSIITSVESSSVSKAAPELPAFMTRPGSASPAKSAEAQPELVVTFSSTPSRSSSYRSPASVSVVTPSADQEYVSQSVPKMALPQAGDYAVSDTTVSHNLKSTTLGLAAAAVIALVVAISGYKYFQSSVTQAAAAAATAAAKQVQAAAAAAPVKPEPAPVAAAPAPAQVQTRIVYVDRPARSSSESKPRESSNAQAVAAPALVTIPDVNVSTGSADAAIQGNSQRSATSELTRSAKPTSTRTAVPRP